MKRAKPLPVRHPYFGEGLKTHEGDGVSRVTFDEAKDGKRQRNVKTADLAVNRLRARLGGYVVPVEPATTWEDYANDLYSQRVVAPDETAAERAFREYLVGVIANHLPLQLRAWKAFKTIARTACKGLYDYSGISTEGPLMDGGKTYSLAVGNFMKALGGEINPRHFGRVTRFGFIDELRKASALKRQPRHEMSDEDVRALDMRMGKQEWSSSMWANRIHRVRKGRSDVGKKRGPNSKPRSDKGKPRRKEST
jgi:hypothetical protein